MQRWYRTHGAHHAYEVISACDHHTLQVFCAVQAVFVNYRLLWTPEPLSATAPPHLFSEQRALEHVQQLSVSGRLVSHPDIEKAVQYILHSSNLLAADAAHRNDVTVEVGLRVHFAVMGTASDASRSHASYRAEHRRPYMIGLSRHIEQVTFTLHASVQVERQQVSGGINMHFLDEHIANAYNNLTNIVLSVTPRETRTEKAVLISAHYDSLIGTVGTRPASPRYVWSAA